MVGPLISVIIPAYQARQWLPECLHSLASQTLEADQFEILLVLNGPEDGSREVIETFSADNPQLQVVTIASQARTAGEARNDGLTAARGSYVAFIDADDWISPDYLQAMGRYANPDRMAIARIVDVRPDGTHETDTALNRAVERERSRFLDPRDAPQALGLNACKLFPRAWFDEVRFVPDLASGEDVVLVCQLLSGFERAGVVLDCGPFQQGATYYRRLTGESVSRRDRNYDFNVLQRLAVVRELAAILNQPDSDRIPLTRGFIRAQLAFVAEYLRTHPEHAGDIAAALADLGQPDITFRDVLASGRISLRNRATTTKHPRGGLLLTAMAAASLNERKAAITALRAANVRIQLQYFSGALTRALEPRTAHRLTAIGPARGAGRTRTAPGNRRGGLAGGAAPARIAGEARRLSGRARQALYRRRPDSSAVARMIAQRDRVARRQARRAGVVLGVDPGGAEILAAMGLDKRSQGAFNVEAAGDLDRYALVIAATRYPPSVGFARAVASSAKRLAEGARDPAGPSAEVWALAGWNLFRGRFYEQAITVLEAGRAVHPSGDAAAMLDIWRRACQVNLAIRPEEPPQAAITPALAAADAALAGNNIELALFLLEGACEVVFAAASNTSSAGALLYREPELTLAPLRASRVWQHLVGRTPTRGPAKHSPPSRSGVVVSPGPYPQFAAPVVRALEEAGATVRVHHAAMLAPRFRWLGIDPTGLREVFEESLGIGAGPSRGLIDSFRTAEIVWCDWADQSAVLASRYAPDDCRVVVRMHGVDATSLWVHLIDWARVSDVIFVSGHQQQLVRRLLGERLAATREHVLPNLVDLDRFPVAKLPSADRTIGMVGWAQTVKDPLWAVEVLSLLRSRDPDWKMVLFGEDFSDFERADEREYARTFRRRVLEDDVRDALRFEGFVRDLPARMPGIGYALSSSLRESQGIGLVEMVASGAVPVVRDWPMYREYGGARSLFPADWIVDTPEEAAQRILDMAADRGANGLHCRELVLRTNDPATVAAQYRAVILGDQDA